MKGCLCEFLPNISDGHVLFEVEDVTPAVQFHQFWHFLGTLKDCIHYVNAKLKLLHFEVLDEDGIKSWKYYKSSLSVTFSFMKPREVIF